MNFWIDEELYDALQHRSTVSGAPMSELIRRALVLFLEHEAQRETPSRPPPNHPVS